MLLARLLQYDDVSQLLVFIYFFVVVVVVFGCILNLSTTADIFFFSY